jgi:hypothetical protein
MTAVTQRPSSVHLQTPLRAKAPEVWAHYLASAAAPAASGLSEGEALRVQRHRDRLLAALQVQDRAALEQAKQDVLQATCLPPGSPALRRALRELSWRMAGLRLPRRPTQ